MSMWTGESSQERREKQEAFERAMQEEMERWLREREEREARRLGGRISVDSLVRFGWFFDDFRSFF